MTTNLTETELDKQITTMVDQAPELVVRDKESFEVAAQFRVELGVLRKKRVSWFKDLVDKANKAHKALTQRRAEALVPIDEADLAVKKEMDAYYKREKEKQRKAQEKLDKQAEEKAERERQKLQKKIDRADTQAEINELQDEKDNVYAEPKIATPTVAKTSRVNVGGSITYKTDIEIEITNPLELLEGIISGRVPQTVYEFKPAKLKAWVKANAVKQGQVPGIRIKEVQVQSVRSG